MHCASTAEKSKVKPTTGNIQTDTSELFTMKTTVPCNVIADANINFCSVEIFTKCHTIHT